MGCRRSGTTGRKTSQPPPPAQRTLASTLTHSPRPREKGAAAVREPHPEGDPGHKHPQLRTAPAWSAQRPQGRTPPNPSCCPCATHTLRVPLRDPWKISFPFGSLQTHALHPFFISKSTEARGQHSAPPTTLCTTAGTWDCTPHTARHRNALCVHSSNSGPPYAHSRDLGHATQSRGTRRTLREPGKSTALTFQAQVSPTLQRVSCWDIPSLTRTQSPLGTVPTV